MSVTRQRLCKTAATVFATAALAGGVLATTAASASAYEPVGGDGGISTIRPRCSLGGVSFPEGQRITVTDESGRVIAESVCVGGTWFELLV
jgi:hypothetical protein